MAEVYKQKNINFARKLSIGMDKVEEEVGVVGLDLKLYRGE